jgi:anti-sigma factor RsiW
MTNRPYITCRELISFIADYVDGVLETDTLFEFERHLAVCPSCVAYLGSYRETIRVAKLTAAAPDLLVEEAPAELIEAILAARNS